MSDDAQYQFAITGHACRICLGRVLERRTFDGRRFYRCACCGIEREGKTPSAICACGIKLRQGHGPMDGGIRCVPNKERSPENMSEIVAQSIMDPKPVAAGAT